MKEMMSLLSSLMRWACRRDSSLEYFPTALIESDMHAIRQSIKGAYKDVV